MNEENPSPSELILFQTDERDVRIEVRLDGGTVWLTQAQIAELYQTTPQNVTIHLKAIYDEKELSEEATCKDYLQVRQEGARRVERRLRHYSLETILAVGYRVRSPRGTQFRQWATARLSEYLVKGFVMDDERLKNPGPGVPDYFDELLARIREIRASEKRVYLRVREILALAADYKPEDKTTQLVFQTVQNKLHFAVSGKTAPELIAQRADAAKPNMGLTTWKGSAVHKGDVTIAKNYMNQEEIENLNRLVTMFLDFAEDQAKRRKQVFIHDWQVKLDEFLRFNERKVLGHAGAISREDADRLAHQQYALFEERRRIAIEATAEADLEAEVKALENKAKEISERKPKPSKKGKA